MNFLDSSRWHAKAHLPFWILFTVHGNFKAVAYGNKDEIKLKVSCLHDQAVDTTNEGRKLTKVNVQDATAKLINHQVRGMPIAEAYA